MRKLKWRVLSLILALAMVLTSVPMTAKAAEYEIGATVDGAKPEDVAGAVWVKSADITCTKEVHEHGESCYTKICDHKDGHLSTCYSTAVYASCTHSNDSEHSGIIGLTDVLTINGTSIEWVEDHPAYEDIHGLYQTAYTNAYNETYASLSSWNPLRESLSKTAGMAAGLKAVQDKPICWTVASYAVADKCTHTCTAYNYEGDNSCWVRDLTKCTKTAHTHGDDCYTWTLYADVNGNGNPDIEEKYTVEYVEVIEGEKQILERYSDLAYGTATPKYTGSKEGYTVSWTPEVVDTVTTPTEGNTITYVATWTPDKDENGDGIYDGQQYCTINITGTDESILVNGKSITLVEGKTTVTVDMNKKGNTVEIAPAEGKYLTGVTLDGVDKDVTATSATVKFDAGVSQTYEVVISSAEKKATVVNAKTDPTVGYYGEEVTATEILDNVFESVIAADNTVVTDDASKLSIVENGFLGSKYTISKKGSLLDWIPNGNSIKKGLFNDVEGTYKITVYYAGDDMHKKSEPLDIIFTLVDGRAESTLELKDNTVAINDLADIPVTEAEIIEALFVQAVADEKVIDNPELSVSSIYKYSKR